MYAYACVSHGIPNIVFRSEYVDSLVLFEDRSRNSFYGTVAGDTFRQEPHVEEVDSPLIAR